jgi:hypothetical protein
VKISEIMDKGLYDLLGLMQFWFTVRDWGLGFEVDGLCF